MRNFIKVDHKFKSRLKDKKKQKNGAKFFKVDKKKSKIPQKYVKTRKNLWNDIKYSANAK